MIEVYHKKKKSRFSKELEDVLIGFTELHSENLINMDNYGQEFYLFLEDSINRSSIIKLRTLFVPSSGTMERFNLDPEHSIFKNT